MTYTSQNAAPKRLVGFSLVVLFHIFLIWVLASGLGSQVVQVIRGPIQTKIIEETVKEKKTPPPPPPKLETPPPFVPPPELSINLPAETSSAGAITTQSKQQQVVQAKPTVVVAARSDPRHPNSKPAYPPTSRRLEEQGQVILSLYILADGKVGEAKVQKSSGYERLDEAALREALNNWHFLPATSDGKPYATWKQVLVTFRLDQ
jgi:protein TonB